MSNRAPGYFIVCHVSLRFQFTLNGMSSLIEAFVLSFLSLWLQSELVFKKIKKILIAIFSCFRTSYFQKVLAFNLVYAPTYA